MKVLLDTCAFLWMVTDAPELSPNALHTGALKPLHRDPFDRLLVSQSRLEGLPPTPS